MRALIDLRLSVNRALVVIKIDRHCSCFLSAPEWQIWSLQLLQPPGLTLLQPLSHRPLLWLLLQTPQHSHQLCPGYTETIRNTPTDIFPYFPHKNSHGGLWCMWNWKCWDSLNMSSENFCELSWEAKYEFKIIAFFLNKSAFLVETKSNYLFKYP